MYLLSHDLNVENVENVKNVKNVENVENVENVKNVENVRITQQGLVCFRSKLVRHKSDVTSSHMIKMMMSANL